MCACIYWSKTCSNSLKKSWSSSERLKSSTKGCHAWTNLNTMHIFVISHDYKRTRTMYGLGQASLVIVRAPRADDPSLSRRSISDAVPPTNTTAQISAMRGCVCVCLCEDVQTAEVMSWAARVPMGMDREASFRLPDRFEPAMMPVTYCCIVVSLLRPFKLWATYCQTLIRKGRNETTTNYHNCFESRTIGSSFQTTPSH